VTTMNNDLLTVTDACKLLGIHPNTLRRADKEGTIRVIRTPGGRRRVPRSEVERLLSRGQPVENIPFGDPPTEA
jgi:putative resolvase